VGYRVLVLETQLAEQVSVPFSALIKQPVARTPANASAVPHVFRLRLPEGHVPDVVGEIKLAALENHWSSVVRQPEVTLEAGGECEVTVYALTAAHAPEIEAAVRKARLKPEDEG
jgi:hypothetical protein